MIPRLVTIKNAIKDKGKDRYSCRNKNVWADNDARTLLLTLNSNVAYDHNTDEQQIEDGESDWICRIDWIFRMQIEETPRTGILYFVLCYNKVI